MQGQHIFVRCRNDQGNAGSWTAARTEQIVEPKVEKNIIEPHCNIDESFARFAFQKNPKNSVLRIYHIDDEETGTQATVVSRTFWETDTITETNGRKGAYTISFILTDDEEVRFNNSNIGAFDPENFEPYSLFAARVNAQPGRKMTVDEQYSLLDADYDAPESSRVFKKAKIDRKAFMAIFSSIYAALEEDRKVAIILPQSVRDEWLQSETASPASEMLSCVLLNLFPPFTRQNIGFASNWSCTLDTGMLSGIHFVFVNPDKPEAYATLKRTGAYVIDLDKGAAAAQTDSEYLAFLWDNRDNPSAIQEFWSYAKEQHRKLLKAIPNRLDAIETIYLIYACSKGGYQDTALCRKGFLAAAELYAGAGSKVPAAEAFLANAIPAVIDRTAALPGEYAEAIAGLIELDKEPTAHQKLEYEIFFDACQRDTLSDDHLEILCAELLKEKRGADDPYFSQFLNSLKSLKESEISAQSVKLVVGVFRTLYLSTDGTRSGILIYPVVELLRQWGDSFQSREKLGCVIDAYRQFLHKGLQDNRLLGDIYAVLARQLASRDQKIVEQASDALVSEEKKLYTGVDGASLEKLTRLEDAFVPLFPLQEHTNLSAREQIYPHFFRLILFRRSEALTKAYQEEVRSVLTASDPSAASLFFSAQDAAVAEISQRQDSQLVSQTMLRLESLALDASERYIPAQTHVIRLFSNLESLTLQDAVIAEKVHLRIRGESFRNCVLEVLHQNPSAFRDFYAYAVFFGTDSRLIAELNTLVGARHQTLMKMVLSSSLASPTFLTEEAYQRFAAWYQTDTSDFQTRVTDGAASVEQYSRALSELTDEINLVYDSQYYKPELVQHCCMPVLADYGQTLLNGVSLNWLPQLPPSDVGQTEKLLQRIRPFCNGEPTLQRYIYLFSDLDRAVRSGVSDDLLSAINTCITNQQGLDRIADLAGRRLSIFAKSTDLAAEKRLDCAIYAQWLQKKDRFDVTALSDYPQQEPTYKRILFVFTVLSRIRSVNNSDLQNHVKASAIRTLEDLHAENANAFGEDAVRSCFSSLNIYPILGKQPCQHLGLIQRASPQSSDASLDLSAYLIAFLLAIVTVAVTAGVIWLLWTVLTGSGLLVMGIIAGVLVAGLILGTRFLSQAL